MDVADIFRAHGAAWVRANAGHVSYAQHKTISAIKACRTAVLGGNVATCEGCEHTIIGYNSCLMGKLGNGESANDSASVDLPFGNLARRVIDVR
jgi:hypothetical protein